MYEYAKDSEHRQVNSLAIYVETSQPNVEQEIGGRSTRNKQTPAVYVAVPAVAKRSRETKQPYVLRQKIDG